MSTSQRRVDSGYAWVVVIVSLAIHSIGLGAPTLLFVSLKPIAADLGTLRAVPSMAYSLLMIGTGAGGLVMGYWMDKRGIFQPVLFGSVMIGIGALMASQAEGRWDLYLANGLLIGLFGKAAMIAPLIANITRWFERRRGVAVAIIASGQGVAGVVWPPIVHYINDLGGWRDSFFYYGLFALLTLVPLVLLLRPEPPGQKVEETHEQSNGNGRVLELPSNLVQLMLWLAVIGCCTAMAVPIVHLVSHATDLGHPAPRAAELLSLLFAASFISRIAYGLLADRIGGIRTLLVGSACQAAMLLAFAAVDSLPGLYLSALLFGLGFAGIMPCYALIIRALFPIHQVGRRIAGQYLFASIGMALGGWLGGVIFDLTGTYIHAFLIAFAFNAMNFAMVGLLHLRQRRFGPRLVVA